MFAKIVIVENIQIKNMFKVAVKKIKVAVRVFKCFVICDLFIRSRSMFDVGVIL